MLDSKQIKQIEAIIDPIIKKKYLKYFQLPQNIRQIMFSVETADQMYQVTQKNHLDNNQGWWAAHTTGMVLLGETNIVNFVKTLQEKCKLTEETSARQLARDINQSIFLPVQESLKKVHQISEWPRGEERKPVMPQTNGPQLNGNIVDLKGE